jgi:hypothetical protein
MVFLLRPPITVHIGFAAQFYKSPQRLASGGRIREKWLELPVHQYNWQVVFQQSLVDSRCGTLVIVCLDIRQFPHSKVRVGAEEKDML